MALGLVRSHHDRPIMGLDRVKTCHPGGGTDVSTIYRDCTNPPVNHAYKVRT
jgi:hypothetical protein